MGQYKQFTQQGYRKAQDIATTINTLGGKAIVGDSYMDYGADISWETILIYSKQLDMNYQGLSPRDFEDINEGRLSLERIKEIVAKATE